MKTQLKVFSVKRFTTVWIAIVIALMLISTAAGKKSSKRITFKSSLSSGGSLINFDKNRMPVEACSESNLLILDTNDLSCRKFFICEKDFRGKWTIRQDICPPHYRFHSYRQHCMKETLVTCTNAENLYHPLKNAVMAKKRIYSVVELIHNNQSNQNENENSNNNKNNHSDNNEQQESYQIERPNNILAL